MFVEAFTHILEIGEYLCKKGCDCVKRIIYILIICIMAGFFTPCFAEDLAEGANCGILMETSTGQVLFEKNPDQQVSIASITKIMTMLIIMERIEAGALAFDDLVTVSENAMSYGGSTMFLEAGEQLSVHDMLKGIAVASANDGCVAMAEHIAGTEGKFVEMMNQRAAQLGMTNTCFKNSNGLDEEGHFSSARDVAIMSCELLKHPKITEYTTIWMDSLRDGKFQLANTNKLIRFYQGATGLKTGSTSQAGCCLSASAQRDGMSLVAVVLGAVDTKTRFSVARALLDYGFSGFCVKNYVEKGSPLGMVAVSKGREKQVAVEASESFSELREKTNTKEAEQGISLPDRISAPVKKGDKVGELTFTVDGKTVKTVDIVASEDVGKKSIFMMLVDLVQSWITGKTA